ncbi:interleukin-18 receptor accessory protein isoform X2 [Kryptolebias marmoratus]|uniref:interleukin-18 receptor accessory protein isoform X2 n=1 Tax=Kryptolebias marmoratus TaxID=37003 RepID=UPI0018AC9C16|nr:interleukin-18 receptor accessory protein isoform X2 [Kryptolebias marmoratus]
MKIWSRSMRAAVALLCFVFLVVSEGCCGKNLRNKPTGLQPAWRYRAVEGEIFRMPCRESGDSWFRTEGKESSSINCQTKFVAEVKHSGTYNNTRFLLTLQVVEKSSLRCFQPNERSVTLRAAVRGTITCPRLTCRNDSNAVWYKEHRRLNKTKRDFCEDGRLLQLCEVFKKDSGVFFCDRQTIESGVTWTFRAAVKVTVVPRFEATTSPEITYPSAEEVEEVELGRPHSLTCKAVFDFELNVSAKVEWFLNHGGNSTNSTPLPMDDPRNKLLFEKTEVTRRARIGEVTARHLNQAFTCVASNAVGTSSVTMRLRARRPVRWRSLIGCPLACFLLAAGLGILLRAKWLEIRLICRSRFQRGNDTGEEKEFDVFLSHVWSPGSPTWAGGSDFISTEAEGPVPSCLSVAEKLNAQRPGEVLLSQVLEDRWGYRVCLLERDILPGGAFTNDVVLALKRSRMLLCVLSADYLADANAVFVLETGVKAFLQNAALRLLLVRTRGTGGTSPSLPRTDPPLSKLLQRSLKVLPGLDWSSDPSSSTADRFWTSLRKALPDRRAAAVSSETSFPQRRFK